MTVRPRDALIKMEDVFTSRLQETELLRLKAEWLAKAASSYQLETMTGRKAPRH